LEAVRLYCIKHTDRTALLESRFRKIENGEADMMRADLGNAHRSLSRTYTDAELPPMDVVTARLPGEVDVPLETVNLSH